MGDYFDPLADEVSGDAIAKAHAAMTAHIHHGAGRYDESTLLHGVRALVAAVRAEAEAHYGEQARKSREFNEGQRARREQENREWLRSMDGWIKEAVAAHGRVHDLLLRVRRTRKTIRVAELAEAMNFDLDG